jgi:hypothetical protein
MNSILEHAGNWVTPAAVGAAAMALLQSALQRRQHRANRLFDVRYEQYQKYLANLEAVSAATNADFQTTLLQSMPHHVAKLLAEPASSNAAIVEMVKDLSSMTARMAEAVSKIQGEIHGLKLVASPELFVMIQQYTSLQAELFAASANLLTRWRDAGVSEPIPAVSPETLVKAAQAETLLQAMIQQMRKELGTTG